MELLWGLRKEIEPGMCSEPPGESHGQLMTSWVSLGATYFPNQGSASLPCSVSNLTDLKVQDLITEDFFSCYVSMCSQSNLGLFWSKESVLYSDLHGATITPNAFWLTLEFPNPSKTNPSGFYSEAAPLKDSWLPLKSSLGLEPEPRISAEEVGEWKTISRVIFKHEWVIQGTEKFEMWEQTSRQLPDQVDPLRSALTIWSMRVRCCFDYNTWFLLSRIQPFLWV